MRERPILFSAPMVRAILDGRKTQTRRVVKPAPDFVADGLPGRCTPRDMRLGRIGELMACPYGAPGDRLWVKETIRKVAEHGDGYASSEYVADGAATVADAWPWQRPTLVSIHCPRGLSRIDLEVIAVRVERLRACSEADALAEGVEPEAPDECVLAYQRLWESINGPRSWSADPWVWVVEFRRVRP